MLVKKKRLDFHLIDKIPFVASLFRGVAQIMLQENVLTGILFLIGIFYGSPVMAGGALLAVFSGTLAAKLFKYNPIEIQQGLYGFSAALVGVALTLFFKPVFWVWIFIVIGSVAATVVQHFFIVKKTAVFTLPFVVITWIIMFLFQKVLFIEPSPLLVAESSIVYNLSYIFHGYGQVIFQSSMFAGVIFFIGVLINSPLAALFGLVGAATAGISSTWLGISTESIGMGLLSYNAVLCAIVFAGKRLENLIWLIISVFLSVIICILMTKYNFMPLTFPFVVATILTLVVRKAFHSFIKKSKLKPLDS